MEETQQINSLSMGRRDFAKVEGARGTLYQKQIIKFGNYVDPWFPEWPMTLDSEWGDMIKENFDKKIVGRVAVPASHTDDPEKNRGELLALENDGEGLNGTLDIRDPQTVQDIENELIWDDSISFTNNYIDEKGIGHGPVLFHVALVNNPYITGMSGFQALSKAASHIRQAFSQKHSGSAIVLSKSVKELSNMKPVKNEKDFPVTVNYQDAEGKDVEAVIEPGQELEVPEATAEGVAQQIATAEKPAEGGENGGEPAANGGEGGEGGEATPPAGGEGGEGGEATPPADTSVSNGGTPSDATTTPNPDSASQAELSKKDREELEAFRANAGEQAFSKLLDEGKVVPAQKEQIVEFAKTHGAEAVTKMFANAKPVIDFSERGSQTEHKSNKEDAAETDLSKNVKQWSDLSQAEQANLKSLNVSEKEYNETALANPKFYQKTVTNTKE